MKHEKLKTCFNKNKNRNGDEEDYSTKNRSG